MNISQLQAWIDANPLAALGALLALAFLIFLIARLIVARGLITLSKRTDTQYDDILVRNLRPFRVAWLAPLVVIYLFTFLAPQYQPSLGPLVLFLILWVTAFTINAMITAMNEIYEEGSGYTGVSIQSYLDILKILILLIGVILSISIFTNESPLVLLTGLGALTAVLLLIFRDTLLSFTASVQIASNNLVREGDWIEVPAFDTDGDVINMSLHTVKIQNFDKTISVIPTHKLLDVSFKNWRGMQDSGGRRIKRSIHVDIESIKFADEELVNKLKSVDLLKDYLAEQLIEIDQYNEAHGVESEFTINSLRLTNIGIFRAYMEAYLANHEAIHKEAMTFLVRELAPGPKGVPLEVYVFTKTTVWTDYEMVQAEVFDHLLAAAPFFGVRVFQEPTGWDFARLAEITRG